MAIANTIPGFEGLTSNASNLIKQLMSGQLGGAQKRAIFDAGAERGVASGMPGSTGIAGSLFANNDLRNIGVSSQQNQQQGFQDLLAMITGFSGTVTPSAGQELGDQASRRSLSYQQQRDAEERRLQNLALGKEQEAKTDLARRKYNFSQFTRAPQWSTAFGLRDTYEGDMDFPSNIKVRPGISGRS